MEDEVAALVGAAAAPLCETSIELGHHAGGAARDGCVPVDEDGLLVCQEQQRVVAIGQLDELEGGSRIAWEAAGLPYLEALEGAQDDEPWSWYPALRVGGVAPVVQRLLAVLAESFCLRWRLHLDDADAGPQHVEEATLLRCLKDRARFATVCPVAGEQLVEEGLGLGALAAFVERPVGREAG